MKPWLPIHPNYRNRNVESLNKDPQSIFNYYRRLISLRKELKVLVDGLFLPLTYQPRTLFAYLRKTNNQQALITLNFIKRKNRLVLGGELSSFPWKIAISSVGKSEPDIRNGILYLEPEEACILY
jgi:glycosidase